MQFHSCCIIGLGLLGGSLAFDLRRAYPAMRVTGIARRQATLDEASALSVDGTGIFDRLTTDLSAVHDADLVVLCTPVQTIMTQLAEIAPHLRPGCVVTDVGSTKRTVMNAAAIALPGTVSFIGGHPMAGSDRAGLEHARPGLYVGATWALCVPPGAETDAARLATLITTLGARPLPLAADRHDALVALSSHLPHVTAAALVNVTLGGEDAEMLRLFIAGGFRDTTRVAAGHPGMWRDICLTNRDQLTHALDALLSELAQWRDAIDAGDGPHLEALLTTAAHHRDALNSVKGTVEKTSS